MPCGMVPRMIPSFFMFNDLARCDPKKKELLCAKIES